MTESLTHGITPWLAVALGGALGACVRFFVVLQVGVPSGVTWPWATFTVNALGSLAFGFLAVALASMTSSDTLRLFVMTGLLGAMTTFSTFAFELVRMVDGKALSLATGYAVASVVCCLTLGLVGLTLGRWLFES